MSNTYPVYCTLSQEVFKEQTNIIHSMNDFISNMGRFREYLLNSTNDFVPNMQTICVSDPKGLYGTKKCTAQMTSC